MRAKHTRHELPAFPVYSSAFLSDTELVIGGGGGQAKSGIKNKLRLYQTEDGTKLTLLDELELAPGEDAPMSMAAARDSSRIICGVNSSEDKLKKGVNENCRVVDVANQKLRSLSAQGTLPTDNIETLIEDYQRVTVVSPDASLAAVAGTHDVSVLTFPGLASLAPPMHYDDEVYDATFSDTTLAIATTAKVYLYDLPPTASSPTSVKTKGKGKAKASSTALQLQRTIDVPTLLGETSAGSIRAARFSTTDPSLLYIAVNTTPARSKNKRTVPRQSFLVSWNTTSGEKGAVDKVKKLGDRALTCCDVSLDGRLIAFGFSDCSVSLLDAATLKPLVTILKAHEFPSTTLTFNPKATLLVSGSADNSVRLISVPAGGKGGISWTTIILIIITLLAAVVAFLTKRA
ncbi:quinon protein alcohol dehydrogenase-like superfamily [Schizophyllum amplum]|uniref:Quinon protein alcohol dehydrogenase-like superfamily n=1 Tax=Schizophyllum amplum TaxID=97359 RepID=A0A550CTZ6_9AGAR|nr:quinon protein alcohol dehydrogenase-like superfamily [Auriculariopsis ampla]